MNKNNLHWKPILLFTAFVVYLYVSREVANHGQNPVEDDTVQAVQHAEHAACIHRACGYMSALDNPARPEVDSSAIEHAEQQANAFQEWAQEWLATDTFARGEELESRGLSLAKARREAMELLIEHAPDTALDHALGYAVYDALPEEIRNQVEQPFSSPVDLDVQVGCGGNGFTSIEHIATNPQGKLLKLSLPSKHRGDLSKQNLPTQGIQLGSRAVIRSEVFQIVEGDDAAFVNAKWPSGQSDPNTCFATGAPIVDEGITAVSGGMVFHFRDPLALADVEIVLAAADAMLGVDVGSSWLLLANQGSTPEQFDAQGFTQYAAVAASAVSTGVKTALFIMVDFPDKPGQPIDPLTLQQNLDGTMSDGLARYSYNLTSITSTVLSATYRIPNPSTTYSAAPGFPGNLHKDAVQAYKDAGNPDPYLSYNYVGVCHTNIGFSWGGLANMGGREMWLQNEVASSVILHEFGHLLGLRHANYWAFNNSNPSSTDPVDPTGISNEYGDVFDRMGDGNLLDGHFNPAAKVLLDWIPASDWGDLTTELNNGTYRIHRFDHGSATGLRALRIAKSASNDHYWVGFRKSYGGLNSFANGAYLTWERFETRSDQNQCWLLDMTPGSGAGKNDAALTLGRTYSDVASNVHITTLATGGSSPNEYLDVVVNFGPFPSNVSPTGTLVAPTASKARETGLFTVEATDANNDNLVYAWDMGDGQFKTSSSSVAHSWAIGGTYNISVTVSDMKGGIVTLQQSIIVSDPLQTWTTQTSGTTSHLYGIATDGQQAVIVGNRIILRSTDGDSWQNVTPSTGFGNVVLNDVCWTGNEFIAVGKISVSSVWYGVVYVSTDGLNWSRDYTHASADTELLDVAYNESGVVVATGMLATTLCRPSGGSWQPVSMGLISTHRIGDLVWGDGEFVLVGHRTVGTYNGEGDIFSSIDGQTWTNYSSVSGLNIGQDFRTISYFANRYVVSGYDSGLRHSSDITQGWQNSKLKSAYLLHSFVSGNGVYYAVGIDRSVSNANIDLISTDAQSWSLVDPNVTNRRNGLAFYNNTLISVGDTGSIRRSPVISQIDHFDDFTSTNFPGGGENSQPDANPDGDWANNLMEYAIGGLPLDTSSRPATPTISFDASGNPVFEVVRIQRRSDVAYSVWWSADLLNWTRQGLSIDTDSSTLLRVVANNQNLSDSKGFFRLQVDR